MRSTSGTCIAGSTANLFVGLTRPATSLSVSPDDTKLAATVEHSDGSGELDIFAMPRLALLAQCRRPPAGKPSSPATVAGCSTATTRAESGRSNAHVEAAGSPARRPRQPRNVRPQPRRPNAGHNIRRRHNTTMGHPVRPPDRHPAPRCRRSPRQRGVRRRRHSSRHAPRQRPWLRLGRSTAVVGATGLARSPGARSHARNGRTASPERDYAPACAHH